MPAADVYALGIWEFEKSRDLRLHLRACRRNVSRAVPMLTATDRISPRDQRGRKGWTSSRDDENCREQDNGNRPVCQAKQVRLGPGHIAEIAIDDTK
jgi:hypothetical protein